MSKPPIQAVKDSNGKVVALIRARLRTTALIAHTKNLFTANKATQDDLIEGLGAGLTPQDLDAETAAADNQPELGIAGQNPAHGEPAAEASKEPAPNAAEPEASESKSVVKRLRTQKEAA